MNFFKRLKTAIFNLDEYGIFVEEKLSVSIKYMFLIITFTSIVLSIITTMRFSKELEKGLNYFENEFPNFSFENNVLKLDNYAEGYDEEYDVKIIADSTPNLDKSKINSYLNSTNDVSTALIVLSDKIIYRSYDLKNEYEYKNLISTLDIKIATKQDIINYFNSIGGSNAIMVTGLIVSFLVLFIENLIEIISYTILVSIVGLIVGRICGIAMKNSVAITLAIYSLTVSVLCSFIYFIVYNYTGFEIKYFSAMYLMIAYVYIIAAILILKTDLMKLSQDLMRIKSVEEQIKDEMKQKELEEEQEKEKNKDEDDDKKTDDGKGDNKKDEPNPEVKQPDIEPNGSEI